MEPGRAGSAHSAVIGLGGDVMLGRLVDEAMASVGYAYPWGDLLTVLRSTDINLINLETTFTTSREAAAKVFTFRAAPDRVQALREARIDACNLANNHVLDFGETGLIETIEVLDAAGIRHVGAGRTAEEAAAPAILERGGVTIGILGYTDNEPGWAARRDRPGTNVIAVDDVERVRADIEAVRPHVDVVIVTTHWGPNMRLRPTPEFRRFARAVIDAGADVLHGHSAQVFQGVEARGRGLILYDTGDLVDDYRVHPALRNDLSFLYLAQAGRTGVIGLKMMPVRITNLQVNRARGEDARLAVERMIALSREFGTAVAEAEPGLLRVSVPAGEPRAAWG